MKFHTDVRFQLERDPVKLKKISRGGNCTICASVLYRKWKNRVD